MENKQEETDEKSKEEKQDLVKPDKDGESSKENKDSEKTAKEIEAEEASKNLERAPRKHTLCYKLPIASGETINVCKTMFLHTLGLRTDGTITQYLMKKLCPDINEEDALKDMRGRQTPKKVQDHSKIRTHIYSYNPTLNPQISIASKYILLL